MSDDPPVFVGFPQPKQNYSKIPHALIEALPLMESGSEVKCILYLLRHTWGYNEFDAPKHLTIDEFMSGRKRSDGTRLDNGTGLSRPSVIKGLRDAAKHGFIEVTTDPQSDRGRIKKLYRLRMESDEVLTSEVKKLDSVMDSPVKKLDSALDKPGKETLPPSEKETKYIETPELKKEKEIEPSISNIPEPTTPEEMAAAANHILNGVIEKWNGNSGSHPYTDAEIEEQVQRALAKYPHPGKRVQS